MIHSDASIALFIPNLDGGGAERITVLLANGLVSRGYKIDLVICNDGGAYSNDIDPRIHLISLNTTRALSALSPLCHYLREYKPDAFISAMSHVNLISILAKKITKSNTKLLVVEHNTFSQSITGLKSKAIKLLIRYLYPHADKIAGVSQGVVDDLIATFNFPKDRVHVLYNPVVSNNLKTLSKEVPSHPWFSDKTIPVFISIGRLTQQKHFSALINAFFKLNQTHNARLVIFGEGELRTQLEQQINSLALTDSVDLPGFIGNPFSHLANCTAFVLSSRWEGLPTVLIEALACGANVISTDCPSGPSEILENGKWGKLVPVDDEAELTIAMRDILDNKNHNAGYTRAEEYTIDKAVDRYINLLASTD